MDAPHTPPMPPLVSVLIPAYNHARFVRRCLDSVLEDPYPNKELVIVDDGSSDGTAECIAAWIAQHGDALHVRFWPRENLGIAATLNHLVAMARGEFLRLGASDDYLLPGGVGVQVAYLGAHPHKAAVIGDAIVVDAQDRTVHQSSMRDLHGVDKRLYLSEAGIRRAVIRHWAVSGAVALVRRSALQPGAEWDEGLRIEDWDFFLRLVARDALGFLDVAVCAYRVHDHNASRTRHLPSRLANLAESRQVALRRARLFDPACRTLLHAQAHYIAAKIAFLRRSPLALGGHLLAHAWLSLLARLRRGGRAALAERA